MQSRLLETDAGYDSARSQKKKRIAWSIGFFLLGALLAAIVAIIIWRVRANHSNGDDGGSGSGPTPWDASDYMENWEYYKNQIQHRFAVEDNMRFSRIGAPVLAGDKKNGYTVVFTRTQYEQHEMKRSATTLWYYKLPWVGTSGALPITKPIWGVSDSQPRWDPKGETIFFLSNRVKDSNGVGSSTQLFQVSIPSSDDSSRTALPNPGQSPYSDPVQLTNYSVDIDNLLVSGITSADNSVSRTLLAISARVYPNMSMDDSKAELKRRSSEGGESLVFDSLFIRHWDEYMDGRRNHIFLVTADQQSTVSTDMAHMADTADMADTAHTAHTAHTADTNQVPTTPLTTTTVLSSPLDIMLSYDSDAPTRPNGSPDSEWSFSATGRQFSFVRQTYDSQSKVAWNTNLDIYTVELELVASVGKDHVLGIRTPPTCRTCDNLGSDSHPSYSPKDENTLIYLSMVTPGYESDRYRLKMINTTATTTTYGADDDEPSSPSYDLTPDWTMSINSVTWQSNGKGVYITYDDDGHQHIDMFASLEDVTRMVYTRFNSTGVSGSVAVPKDGDEFFLFTETNYNNPTDIFIRCPTTDLSMCGGNSPFVSLTAGFNAEMHSLLEMAQSLSILRVPSKDPNGNPITVQGFLLTPPDFDKTKTYPLAFLIHGGPQSPWDNSWSYRWNPQIYAAYGYITVLINFQGSPGWGQQFTDSIQGRYGTLPYGDLINSINWLIDESEWKNSIDSNRMAALGASFGGYTINWLAGHNINLKYPFKALVCHDGMFDLRSFYYMTEELYFPEHDVGGVAGSTPYNNASVYEEFNPARPDLVSNWKTPHMIIHGGLDYRIDLSQGISAFTALQRQGTPSKMLFFPREAHQVFNTRNQIKWHHEVLGWIGKWTNTPNPL